MIFPDPENLELIHELLFLIRCLFKLFCIIECRIDFI